MAFNRNIIIIFGLYALACSYLVSGKAIDGGGVKSSKDTSDSLLPPLIFPTDPTRNNIMPINKTLIKILMHEDDLTNSSAPMTKESDKETGIQLTSSEVDDLRKTDQLIATSEEEHVQYAKLHPETAPVTEKAPLIPGVGPKDQAENIQEINTNMVSELEEQYNRPAQSFINVSVVNVNHTKTVRDHLAWISVTIVLLLGLAIYGVLFLWRTKLEQRYGDRHRLYEEDTL